MGPGNTPAPPWGRRHTQNVIFRPSCTARLPPEPMTGLAAATSGVAHPHPNEPVEGSLCANPFCPPNGLARLGWLKMLKNSTRNCAPRRSPSFQFLATEKSTFLNPVSRKMFRPIVPKVPGVGGIMKELPFAKQPNAANAPLVGPPGMPPSRATAWLLQD